jgi:hypothetical protein
MVNGLVIFDEFFFLKEQVIAAVLPTLATGACLAITSSVPTDTNIPSMDILESKYPDGTPALKNLNWISVCLVLLYIIMI